MRNSRIVSEISTMLLILQLSASGALAEDLPDASQVEIRGVTASGTGCPEGTVSTTMAPDNSAFTLMFDQYEASAGSANLKADKKVCDIRVEVAVPQGWQFSLHSADYRGFAAVDAGAIAVHQVVYEFDDMVYASTPIPRRGGGPVNRIRPSFSVKEFRGPFTEEYFLHSELPPSKMAWSACDNRSSKVLKINTGLLARVLTSTAGPKVQISLDTVDGALNQEFGMRWRKCPGQRPTPVPPPRRMPPRRGWNVRSLGV